MPKVNLPNYRATQQGYTIHALAECEGETLDVLLRDDCDTDGLVSAWDTASQCFIELNGAFWTFNVTEASDQW